jgi:DNA-directed RNA polymerase subunit RPC12/RpoP
VPMAWKAALVGSIRHRANKAERCERVELAEIAAALQAFSELVVVSDPAAARAIQTVVACVVAQVDSETDPSLVMLVPPGTPLEGREWYTCTKCGRKFAAKTAPRDGECWTCMRAEYVKTGFNQGKLNLYPVKRIRARYGKS